LVNEEFGGICDPSGIVMSRTNCAWSQTAVAVAAGGRVEAGGKVGKEADVLVATAAGRVGVLKLRGAVGVSCACTVSAAAVKTTLDALVGVGALDGKLHAENRKLITIKMERLRAALNILLLLVSK
jgi:hypothetical protein